MKIIKNEKSLTCPGSSEIIHRWAEVGFPLLYLSSSKKQMKTINFGFPFKWSSQQEGSSISSLALLGSRMVQWLRMTAGFELTQMLAIRCPKGSPRTGNYSERGPSLWPRWILCKFIIHGTNCNHATIRHAPVCAAVNRKRETHTGREDSDLSIFLTAI